MDGMKIGSPIYHYQFFYAAAVTQPSGGNIGGVAHIPGGVQHFALSLAGYGHEWRFWDMQVEKFLDWIPRSDPCGLAGKRQV
jgi:hypothetical protein